LSALHEVSIHETDQGNWSTECGRAELQRIGRQLPEGIAWLAGWRGSRGIEAIDYRGRPRHAKISPPSGATVAASQVSDCRPDFKPNTKSIASCCGSRD